MANNDNWRSNSGAPVNDPKYPSGSTQTFIGTTKNHITFIQDPNGTTVGVGGRGNLKPINIASRLIADVLKRNS
jgi:hypothetical protein